MSESATIPIPKQLSNGEAQVLQHLDAATFAFREHCSQSPAELESFNAGMDSLRRQYVFRDVPVALQEQVYLCMPRCGPVEYEPVSAMYMAAGAGSRYGVIATDKATSATPSSFNMGWCDAFNAWNADGSQTFKWFCLLHSDVFPHNGIPNDQRPWLQVMMDEANAGGYDVMHAVVAIKDGRGLTSTAVGLKDFKDQYAKVRRLTVTELQQLPETFDHKDCLDKLGHDGWEPILQGQGYPAKSQYATDGGEQRWLQDQLCMLNNTGCMLVRLTPRMKRFHGFRFQNKVVLLIDGKEYDMGDFDSLDRIGALAWETLPDGRKEPVLIKGAIVPKFTPEDWDFGRWCANHGLRVGGTRKVSTSHIGRGVYVNNCAWGNEQRDEWWANP